MSSPQSASLIAIRPNFETRRAAVTVGKLWTLDVQQQSLHSLAPLVGALPSNTEGATANVPAALRLNGWLDHYIDLDERDARDEARKQLVECLPMCGAARVGELFLPFEQADSAAYAKSDDDRVHRLIDLLSSVRFDFGVAAVRIHITMTEQSYPATPRELRHLIDEANSPWVVASSPPLGATRPLPNDFFTLLAHRVASISFRDAEQARQALSVGASTQSDAANPLLLVGKWNHRPLIILEEGEPSDELLQQLNQVETIYAQSAKIDPQAPTS